MDISTITEQNFPEVQEIYAEGIATGIATFETLVPTWETWDHSHLPFGRMAGFIDGKMAGWAALSPVSSRCVYGGVAEVSVYVRAVFRGQQIGSRLLAALIATSEKNGIWTLQSSLLPANKASFQIHKKNGFRKIGFREKIGQLHGVWYDNIIMERRSKVVGT